MKELMKIYGYFDSSKFKIPCEVKNLLFGLTLQQLQILSITLRNKAILQNINNLTDLINLL